MSRHDPVVSVTRLLATVASRESGKGRTFHEQFIGSPANLIDNHLLKSVHRDRNTMENTGHVQIPNYTGAKCSYGTHPKDRHQTRDGRPSPRAQPRVSISTSSPRPAGNARPCLHTAAQRDTCARLLLAPARLPTWAQTAFRQSGLLASQARWQCQARPYCTCAASGTGLACARNLGVRDAGTIRPAGCGHAVSPNRAWRAKWRRSDCI